MELQVKLSNGWNKNFLKIIRFAFLGVSEQASDRVSCADGTGSKMWAL